MATQAQMDNLAKARIALAAKKQQKEAAAPAGLLSKMMLGSQQAEPGDMLSADYIRKTAVATEPGEIDLAQYGIADHEEIKSEVEAKGGVPIVDSSEVAKLNAYIAELEARNSVMEQNLANSPRGVQVFPEPADDYVQAEDMSVKELNMLNGSDVVARAQAEGRIKSGLSKILHSNSLSQYDAQLRSSTFWMYAPDGTARQIMRQSVESAKHSGLATSCPLCGGWHKESETDPNACPVKAKAKFTLCEVCANNGFERYIYDAPESAPLDRFGNPVVIGSKKKDDPNFVRLTTAATAKDRLQIRLEDHIRAFHISTAASMHLAPMELVPAGSGVV